ncbi:uncharacterized protein [Triticum aestivum]|uniref:uncharacterized protein n=1 Tax=Triticum aestivum TaxID=4565 RepID=UPI001D01367E|nr:uncharacterized protein LOC123191769 [Triticum aestivum]
MDTLLPKLASSNLHLPLAASLLAFCARPLARRHLVDPGELAPPSTTAAAALHQSQRATCPSEVVRSQPRVATSSAPPPHPTRPGAARSRPARARPHPPRRWRRTSRLAPPARSRGDRDLAITRPLLFPEDPAVVSPLSAAPRSRSSELAVGPVSLPHRPDLAGSGRIRPAMRSPAFFLLLRVAPMLASRHHRRPFLCLCGSERRTMPVPPFALVGLLGLKAQPRNAGLLAYVSFHPALGPCSVRPAYRFGLHVFFPFYEFSI